MPLLALLAASLSGACTTDRDQLLDEVGIIGQEVDAGEATPTVAPPDDELHELLAALEARYADAVAAFLRDGEVDAEVEALVHGAYTDALARRILATLSDLGPAERAVFRPHADVGPRRHTQVTVLEATDVCLHLETVVDDRALVVDAPAPRPSFVVLHRTDPATPTVPDVLDWAVARLPAGDPEVLRHARRC